MPETNSQLEQLKKARRVHYRHFNREHDVAVGLLTAEATRDEIAEITTRLEEMENALREYNTINANITELILHAEDIDEKSCDSLLDEISIRRTEDKIKIRKIQNFLDEHNKSTIPTPGVSDEKPTHFSGTAKLPKLKLPTFTGNFITWTSFWDTIESDVLSGAYSDITKFNYIIGQLQGSALDAVRGIHASGANLSNLTTLLKERFGQKRKIVRAHVTEIMSVPSPSYEFNSLTKFYNKITGNIRSLQHLGIPTEDCASFIVPIIERKLPQKMAEKMGTCGQVDDFDLTLFLKAFQENMENLGEQNNEDKCVRSVSTTGSFVSVPHVRTCEFCKSEHLHVRCPLNAKQRLAKAKSQNLCFKCLRKHTRFESCRGNLRGPPCYTCRGSGHHTALHDCFQHNNGSTVNQPATQMTTGCSINCHALLNESPHTLVSELTDLGSNPVLLETGIVDMEFNSNKRRVSVLMDRGSMLSYITRKTADHLQLVTHAKKSMFINGFGGKTTKKLFEVSTVGIVTSEGTKCIDVIITDDDIVKPIVRTDWEKCLNYRYISNLDLADDFRDKIFTVDCLIGCDSAYLFLENRIIKGEGPMVQFSNIGCFVSGPLRSTNTSSDVSTTALSINDWTSPETWNDRHIERYLRTHMLDERDVRTEDSTDDNFKLDYMDRIKMINGSYYVPLPWKNDHPELPNNVETSKSRLFQVTSRLKKLGLTEAYVAVMQENINKGYISELQNSEHAMKQKDSHFLPHFPVLRDSETTPVRIVFDASCGSPSLNDCLYEGPNMIQDLVKLLMMFRTKKVALSADIARAFLSVKLLESDRQYVRFMWFKDNDVNKEIVPYTCNTVIFGNVSSPFALAITLEKHLAAFESPIAQDIIGRLYVDNLLTGVNSAAEAIEYYQESRKIMKDGSFDLRQWTSNCNELMKMSIKDGSQAKSGVVSTLGLSWNPDSDKLYITRKDLPINTKLTKRMVVSQTSSIFDPLGLIGPLLIPAKVFVNNLWNESKSWDEPLSSDEVENWNIISQSLRRVDEIQFPRWLQFNPTNRLELIVFCDACPMAAIGCVAFGKQDEIVKLLGSKNKVVSKKNTNLTVPKLELQAMFMGAQYAKVLVDTYGREYKNIDVIFVTDSEIALYWIKSDKKLKQFVKNRVDTIRKISDVNKWYHVTTKTNIADILSRGATIAELVKSEWIQGPDWLKSDRQAWPISTIGNSNHMTMMAAGVDIENEFQMRVPQVPAANIASVIDVSRFSDYNKLLRVTALVSRAFRKDLVNNRSQLGSEDITRAESQWLHHTQRTTYGDVLEYLKKEKSGIKKLPRKPSIVNQLGLIIDENDYIRCGGRLKNANIHFDRKYPILLPNNSYITTLIIRNAHHVMVHYGVGSTMSQLRKRYWITSMRASVKKVINKCVICKKVTGRPYLAPPAPDLPDFRVNDLQAFEATAVDFTGHIYVKRDEVTRKAYVCLFTCCTTRAVHLEIVPDMTVEAFMRAFRRFTSAYCIPKIIYCDNAKTFKSSEAELKKLYNNVYSDICKKELAKQRIKFKYTPVQAPWMGGVHERLIGVCKNAIKKTLGKALVSDDEMRTVIKEIQNIINNRPLTYQSADPAELQPLTPNHLVFGHEINILPHEEVDNTDFDPTFGGKTKLEKIVHRRSQLITHFRQRFYDEYLSTLRERHAREIHKQNGQVEIIGVGDVVLIHDKDEPRKHWKLGVIKRLIRSKDNFTRAATVQTTSGTSNRAISKLYPLELNCEPEVVKPNTENDKSINVRPKRAAADKARAKIRQQLDDSE